MSVFDIHRRKSREVNIGGKRLGGVNPIRLQSMTNTSTNDIDDSVNQIVEIAAAGADYVRLTAQGTREADSIGKIRQILREKGCNIPLIADIHFNPKAAFAAAVQCEKVRINPGNFMDPGRVFKHIEYSDEEYAAEMKRLRESLTPLLALCKEHGTAIRIGVNHGSLSDRIMSRYGDTPAGVVESAMEFMRVCREEDFNDVVLSVKCSNTPLMVKTVLLLCDAMQKEGFDYPIHLGVTEAGDAEDGRIKSALGIGTLLARGIGDTIRVSLSELPQNEIPVAALLARHIAELSDSPSVGDFDYAPGYNPLNPERRTSVAIDNVGGDNQPVVIGLDDINSNHLVDVSADSGIDTIKDTVRANGDKIINLTSSHQNAPAKIRAVTHALTAAGLRNPVIVTLNYPDMAYDEVIIRASADFGLLLLDGICDGIQIKANLLTDEQIVDLSLRILQAARLRVTNTEYIACPGCGRTLFDLQKTLSDVKKATSHLAGLKIGVMGCIVNGPGEMADADYGYVGAGPGNVSIYRNKERILHNIPAKDALDALIDLIKSDGKWIDKE